VCKELQFLEEEMKWIVEAGGLGADAQIKNADADHQTSAYALQA
jgi:hypothetical protein